MGISEWLFGMQEAIQQQRVSLDHPAQLSDLNAPMANTTLWSTTRGGVVSVIAIEGSREYVMETNHELHLDELERSISAHLKSKSTDLCWLHVHNDEISSNVDAIEQCLKGVRAVSEIQGYNNRIFIQELVDDLAPHIQKEKTILCVWTNRKEQTRKKKSTIPFLKERESQDALGLQTIEKLGASHKAKINMIMEGFKSTGIKARLLSNREVGHHIGETLDPEANRRFVPRLLGQIRQGVDGPLDDKYQRFFLTEPANRFKAKKGKDYTCIFPPTIARQVWTTKPVYKEDYVVVGRRAFASLMFTMLPNGPVAFEALVGNLKRQGVPFRISMHSSSNSITAMLVKYMTATVLKKVPPNNEAIFDSIRKVRKYKKHNRSTLSLQVVITVWAPRGDEELMRERIEQTQKAINAWEGAQALLMSDDPVLGMCTTLAPYTSRSAAPVSIGPTKDIMYMAPITRPGLPWDEGGVLLRSPTGKLMPFQPLSDHLSHHVYLICGEPGYGKSLLCQIILIAIAETHDILPYVAITDVGTSSLGTVRYLQNILPVHRKHQVLYTEMQNSRDMSINRFDTPLGCRYPIEEDFQGMRDWTLLGVSDSQTGETKDGMDTCIADTIKLAFDRCADKGPRAEPKRHEQANESDPYWGTVIQPALNRHNLTVSRDTIYWKLVDVLFEKGEYQAAGLVQRFAVPLLADVMSACNDNSIRQAHRNEISRGFTLAEYAHQRLRGLYSELHVTHAPTQFDLTDIRVSAFNLENVVQNAESVSAKRQGGLYLGLTSVMQVEPFFWNADRVRMMPRKYQAYHRERVDEVRKTRNIYFADEQQYFTGIPVADRIPDNIATLGRKRNIGVMLSTQLPQYFTPIMRDLSKIRIYVGFERSSIKNVVKTMELNEIEEYLLRNSIRRPGRNGSHFLMQVEAEDGYYSQLCNLRVGIRKLWGVSTKPISVEVRDAIIKEFGYEKGVDILRREFPSGEVEDEYERLRTQLSESRNTTGLETTEEITKISDIVRHMIDKTIRRGEAMYAQGVVANE